MAVHELYKKVLIDISTTLTEAILRRQLGALEASMKAQITSTAAADPDMSLVGFRDYRLNLNSDLSQLYPKLLFTIESRLDEDEVETRFDAFPAAFQGLFKGMVAAPQTDILGWHLHLSTGSVDEVEP